MRALADGSDGEVAGIRGDFNGFDLSKAHIRTVLCERKVNLHNLTATILGISVQQQLSNTLIQKLVPGMQSCHV